MVWGATAQPLGDGVRPVVDTLDALPPLDRAWCETLAFAARYYQRALGEMVLTALPPALKNTTQNQLARRVKKLAPQGSPIATPPMPATPEQTAALEGLRLCTQPVLLYGATGSGKTEVYLQAAQRVLADDPAAQVLVLVPEINLTPQLESRFAQRFGEQQVVTLHSGLTPAQRLNHWLLAHLGLARIVLGTRVAALASLPGLRLVVVDEEHDPSYKSQEGARYSARDLAVYRAQATSRWGPHNGEVQPGRCQVLLGSATPSLESWHAAQQQRYKLLSMPSRVGQGNLPEIRLVDMGRQPKGALLAPPVIEAIAERVTVGEQCMVLLNRRGYAPVLGCHSCGWKSDCPYCSAHQVFHKTDRTLRCHHCGHTAPVPRACPGCGDLDIAPLGRGTEQLEERLLEWLAGVRRPDGQAARVVRLDADSTRTAGSLAQKLSSVHTGEADVLIGTQMIAKGHDFRRITLVVSVNTDNGLFASDYRAPERLFALLMQAAGRAGRDATFMATTGRRAALWVQTWYPQHPLFGALSAHDFATFAAQQLAERQTAQMPPFGYQALVRAEARTQAAAQAFLNQAAACKDLPGQDHVLVYPAVPAAIQRVANIERAQMLLESSSRPALQAFLAAWQPVLHATRAHPEAQGLVRWAVDVDPLVL
jgi:primosomal protein N' (replication factor Y)